MVGIIYPKVIKLSALIPVVKKVFPNPHGLAVLTDAGPVSPFTALEPRRLLEDPV